MTAAEQQNKVLTVKLNNGVRVLAKLYKGQPTAKTFANRTQANAAAAVVGGFVKVGYPFYVVVPSAEVAA